MLTPSYSLLGNVRPQTSPHAAPPLAPTSNVPAVWMIESQPEYECYSNGLRIDTRLRVATRTRPFYRTIPRGNLSAGSAELRRVPAGIVFHTTRTCLMPFRAGHTGGPEQVSGAALSLMQRSGSYHYFIDRFGRVFRIAEEAGVANHAGSSVWADDDYAYVTLNESFLAVAFEIETARIERPSVATPAQLDAGRILIQMLRSRYGIPRSNCVTHAQVSVNPANMRIGFHTDWAGGFPFAELGLGNTFAEPSPALVLFGFGYDADFLRATGARPWPGIALSDEIVSQEADSRGVPLPKYRETLQQLYREIAAAPRVQQ